MKRNILPVFFLLIACNSFSQISTPQVAVKPSTQLKPDPALAYFVVTINGFTCNRETWDDALERDGKRDEVFLLAKTMTLQNNKLVSEQTKRSVVMGDINNRSASENRSQAGMVEGFKGGIKTADNIPSTQPWKKNDKPAVEHLPLMVYQGLLAPNNNTTVQIIPSIWEWDGPTDFFNKAMELINKPFTDIVNLAAGNDPVRQMIITRANQDFRFYNMILKRNPGPGTEVIVNRDVFGDPKDRPVGMMLNPQTNQFVYYPIGIKLTYETASAISETDMGYGKGVFGMQFRDHEDLKGDYTIYIQIEKIPVKGQSLTIQPRAVNNFLPNKLYTIKNAESGKVMSVSTDYRQTIIMTGETGNTIEKWRVRKIADNYYIITNEQLGKNLTSYSTGNELLLYDQNGGNQQHWYMVVQADGSYRLFNRENRDHPVSQSDQYRPTIALSLSNAQAGKWLIEEVK